MAALPATPIATTAFPRSTIRVTARCALALLLAASGAATADDGDPDPTFSGDGKALVAWPTTYSGMDVLQVSTEGVAVLGDGSVVTVGAFDTASVGDDDFDACGVAKLTPSGAVDAAFGLGGWQLVYLEAQPFNDDCVGILPAPGNGMFVIAATESMARPYEVLGVVNMVFVKGTKEAAITTTRTMKIKCTMLSLSALITSALCWIASPVSPIFTSSASNFSRKAGKLSWAL